MIVLPVVSIISALYFYVQALKNAMHPKRWGFLGLCLGPLVWPFFSSHKRMHEIRHKIAQAAFFRA